VAVAVNGGAAQRSRVTQVTVRWDSAVTLPADLSAVFRLTRTGPGGPAGDVALAVDLSGSTVAQTVARLTFSGPLTESGSLIDGNYTLSVFGSRVTGSGGLPGVGDTTTSFHRLFGDADGDRDVDALDFFRLRDAFGKAAGTPGYLADFDADADGDVDALDLFRFRNRFGITLSP
jgi:hypothetical protein